MKSAKNLYRDFIGKYNLWYEHINTEEPNWHREDLKLKEKSDKSLSSLYNHLKKAGINITKDELETIATKAILGGNKKTINSIIKKADKSKLLKVRQPNLSYKMPKQKMLNKKSGIC